MEIKEIVENQRKYFNDGKTLSIKSRIEVLKKLEKLIIKYTPKFLTAFKSDLNKSEFDVLTTEIYLVLDECRYKIKNIKKLTKPKKVRTSITNFPSKGYLLQEPYGVTLIMAPWNYPLQLALCPLFGSIAAGNTVVLKPASYAKEVSKTIFEMIEEFNNPNLISVVLGGRNENQELLNQKFDYIFFTGGVTVGKLVLQKASENITPVTLELGGKSPCVVLKDADVKLAAKRITWGKFLNAGQTCVAPDYICVDKSIHDDFIKYVKQYINDYYYTNNEINNTFTHLINDKHKEKLLSLLEKEKVINNIKADGLLMEPIIMDNISFNDKIMQEEIFGPIMPIISFENEETLFNNIKTIDKPLAFYLFTNDKNKAKDILNKMPFGGGCINDTVMHLTNTNLPFGGVGKSGMGSYHGKKSFETFSHQKSLLKKGKLELNIKYPPVNEKKIKFIKKLAKIK